MSNANSAIIKTPNMIPGNSVVEAQVSEEMAIIVEMDTLTMSNGGESGKTRKMDLTRQCTMMWGL